MCTVACEGWLDGYCYSNVLICDAGLILSSSFDYRKYLQIEGLLFPKGI